MVVFPVDPRERPPSVLVTGGRVIDPVNGIDDYLTMALAEGVVAGVGKAAPEGFQPEVTIDAKGMWVVPGLMDMHVHLREPGSEDKETIATGTQAAAAGGFTALACMPNTNPALDEESKIRYVIQRSEQCPCRVFPVGAITTDLAGEKLAPFGEMVRAGARAFSDDGHSVRNSYMMRNAFNYSKSFGVPLICHCEDHTLTGNRHMNESAMSTRLGIRGIPSIAEEIIVARDIMIAEYTGARVHIAHVTTAGAVHIVREAKARGAAVTCETCPHYFTFVDEDLATYDTNKKMNPPLRTPRDRQAVIDGLADGTIDVIASDHAPHCAEEKDVEFAAAAFGVIGLETSLAAAITRLIDTGALMPSDLVEKMSVAPNRILNLDGGALSRSAPADVTIIDPSAQWTVDPSAFFSKSRNAPFAGMAMRGRAHATILGGRPVFSR
ncbi:MAG: amidohydrolase family protein [Chitinivibrionales bacterium]|nr:amidohydrolase family protein [Chitinivibrionales bacterium]MBD3394670.1 amidohydrolase family protein [Chitinivibrionales bacterium]